MLAAGSVAVGGPVGRHAAAHPFWSPLRVVLALVTLAGVLNLAHTAPCQSGAWWDGQAYANLCYSDIPLSYVPAGHVEGLLPSDGAGRYPASTDPAPVAALAWLTGSVTRLVTDDGDLPDRSRLSVRRLAAEPEIQQEAVTFYALYALLMVGAMLIVGGLLVGLSGRRRWDAAAFAIAPVLVLAATIGWDLVGVALTVAALWAWSRDRPAAAGVLLGSAVAAAVWPVALLAATGVLAVRARELRAFGAFAGVGAGVWALWQLPVLARGGGGWVDTVNHTLQGQIGYGSLWRLAATYGVTVSPGALVWTVAVAVALVTVLVSLLALRARRRPRLPQLVFLLLVGGLLVWPVYSPQYVLWLLPFAVLARPRWRDLLIWQAGEVLYFLAIWWTLSGATVDAGGVDKPYAAAIALRVAAELWLAAVVLRDVLRPEHDPVRADLVTDDPAGGVLAEPDVPAAVALSR